MRHGTRFILALLSFLFFGPLLYLVLLSTSSHWNYPSILPVLSTIHWKEMISGSNGLLQSLFYSLFISLFVASATTVTGFFLSRIISRHRKKKWLIVFCYFPFVMSPVIYALMLNHFFIVAAVTGTLPGVLLAQAFITLPYSILLLTAFWDDKIISLEQLSYTLGASPLESLLKVVLPMARAPLILCFFQVFLVSWFEFGLTQVIGVGKVQTLTIKVYEYVAEANVFFAAISCLLILIPPVILLRLNKNVVLPTFD